MKPEEEEEMMKLIDVVLHHLNKTVVTDKASFIGSRRWKH